MYIHLNFFTRTEHGIIFVTIDYEHPQSVICATLVDYVSSKLCRLLIPPLKIGSTCRCKWCFRRFRNITLIFIESINFFPIFIHVIHVVSTGSVSFYWSSAAPKTTPKCFSNLSTLSSRSPLSLRTATRSSQLVASQPPSSARG